MRKIFLLVILFCMSATTSDAGMILTGGRTPANFPCKSATVDGQGNTVIFCEDFEGALYCEGGAGDQNCRHAFELGETCTVLPDYNAAAMDARSGSNSVLCNESAGNSGCARFYNLTGITNLYLFGKIKFHVNALSNAGMTFYRMTTADGATNHCAADILDDDTGNSKHFAVYNNSSATNCTDCPIPALDTVYYVWLEYVKGNPGTCKLYVGTTPVKTSAGSVQVNTSINTTIDDFVPIRCNAEVLDEIKYDNIILKATPIGDIVE